MNYKIDAISKSTHFAPEALSESDSLSESVHDTHLDNIVLDAFNKLSEIDTNFNNKIDALTSANAAYDDPRNAITLQILVGNRMNLINTVSTVARKCVAAIEKLGSNT